MAHCIDINDERVGKLAEALNLPKIVIAAKISLWQEKQEDGLTKWPTKNQLLGNLIQDSIVDNKQAREESLASITREVRSLNGEDEVYYVSNIPHPKYERTFIGGFSKTDAERAVNKYYDELGKTAQKSTRTGWGTVKDDKTVGGVELPSIYRSNIYEDPDFNAIAYRHTERINYLFDYSRSSDIVTILQRIADDKTGYYSELANSLIEIAKINNIKVYAKRELKEETWEGVYVHADDGKTASIELLDHPAIAIDNVLMHEILHALTFISLRTSSNSNINARIEKLFEYAKTQLDGHYGLTDLDEFISELYADRQFGEALKRLPAYKAENGNLLMDFINLILELLGLNKSESLYEQALVVAEQVIVNNSESAVKEFYSKEYVDEYATKPYMSTRQSNDYQLWNKEEELEWLRTNLPNTSTEVWGNLKNVWAQGGHNAWGLFMNSAIYLASDARKGTAYHEAFHAVFNLYLSDSEKLELLKEGREKYGVDNDLDVEEAMSEDFREWKESRLTNTINAEVNPSIWDKLTKFFQGIWNFLFDYKQSKPNIDRIFDRINTGFYANKIPSLQANDNVYLSTRIPGMTPSERRSRVSMISSLFFEALNDVSVETGMSEQKVLKKYSSLDLFKRVGKRLYNQAELFVSKGQQEKADKVYHMLDLFLQLNDDGTVRKKGKLMYLVARDLRNYGINIPVKNDPLESSKKGGDNKISVNNVNDLIEEENMEMEDAKETWQIGRFETNQADTMSFRVKSILRRLVETNPDGTPVRDDLGFTKFINFTNVYAYMLRNLNGLEGYAVMRDKLESLAAYRPELLQVIDKLAGDEQLQSAFASNMAVNKFKFVLAREVKRQEMMEIDIMDSDRFSSEKLILDDWRSNLVSGVRNSVTTNGVVDQEKLEKLRQWFDNKITTIKSSGEFEIDDAEDLSTIIKGLGIDLTADDIYSQFDEMIENGVTIPKMRSLLNLLTSANNGISVIFDYMRDNGSPFTSESNSLVRSAMENITELIGRNHLDIKQASFRNVEDKNIYTYSLPNFLSRRVRDLKAGNMFDYYQSTPFYKDSMWLKEMKENGQVLDKFNFVMLDGFKPEKASKGVRYTKLSEQQLEITKQAMFMNPSETGYAYYTFPILSDAPAMVFVKFKKYNTQESMDNLWSLAQQEHARITQTKRDHANWTREEQSATTPEDKSKIRQKFVKNFHYGSGKTWDEQKANANGLKFMYLPFMNGVTFDRATFDQKMNEVLSNDVAKDIKRLTKMGVLEVTESGRTIMANGNLTALATQYNGDITKFLTDYNLNSRYATSQMMSLFSGDLAFYKNADDFVKRNKQVHAPGTLLDTTHIRDTYRTMYMADRIVPTLYLPAIVAGLVASGMNAKEAAEIAKKYTAINEADAQAYITLERRVEIFKGQGLYTNEKKRAYERLKNREGTVKDFEAFEIVKPFVFTHIKKGDLIVPTQNKNSEYVLFPQFVDQSKELSILLKHMEENQIDSIQFESAVKAGLHNMYTPNADFSNTNEIKYVELSNADYRIQQPVPEHHLDTDVLFGTQIRKLIAADLKLDGTYGGMTAKELVAEYNKAIAIDLQHSYNELKRHFKNDDGTVNIAAIKQILMDEVDRKGLSDQLIDALEIEVHPETGKWRFALPLYHRLHGDKIESMMMSLIDKRIIRQKQSGGTVVQVSSFGYSDKLRPPRGMTIYEAARELYRDKIDELESMFEGNEQELKRIKDGNLVFTSAGASPYANVFTEEELTAIKQYEEVNRDVILPAEIMMPWWSRSLFVEDGGEVNIQKIQAVNPELLQGIGYRIPTEDKYSMLPFKIVGFMPAEAGSAMMVPTEITVMSGGDFDVDKVFFFLPTTGKDKETGKIDKVEEGFDSKAARDNKKFNLMWKVLTDAKTYPAMMAGNSFDNLKDLRTTINKLKGISSEQLDPLAPSTHTEYFKRIMAGKNLIGIFANQNVNHAATQHADISLGVIEINGVKRGTISKQTNIKGGLISKSLGSFLAASVDNAKDPVLGYLNVNTLTADYLTAIIRHGFSEETAMLILNQPIIIDLSEKFFNAGGKSWQLKGVMKELYESYDPTNRQAAAGVVFENGKRPILQLSNDQLSNLILQGSTDNKNTNYIASQTNVLKFFESLEDIVSNQMNMVSATRSDSSGPGSKLAELEARLDSIESVGKNKSITGLAELLDDKTYYSMIRAFNLYGLKLPYEFLSELFPYAQEGFRNVKKNIGEALNRELTLDEVDLVNKAYVDYVIGTYPWFDQTYQTKEKIMSLMTTQFFELKDASKEFRDNALIRNLSLDEKGNLEFKSVGTLSEADKATTSDDWEYLIENGVNSSDTTLNNKVKNWARNLVRYGSYTVGNGFNPTGYMHLVPVSFYKNLTVDGYSLRQHFDKFESKVSNPEFEDYVFLDQLIRNNPEIMPMIRLKEIHGEALFLGDIMTSIVVDENSQLAKKSYNEETDSIDITYSKYTRVRVNGSDKVFMNIPSTSKYGVYYQVPRLGTDRVKEFSASPFIKTMIEENGLDFKNTPVGATLRSTDVWTLMTRIANKDDFFHNAISPVDDSEAMFQLSADTKAKNEKLDSYLKGYLSGMGVKVEAVKSLMERFGYDAVAASLFAEKLILVVQGKESSTTLPEEAAHFILEAIKDSPIYTQMLELASQSNKYAEVSSEYANAYGNDVEMLKKETAAKLLADAIVNEFENSETKESQSWFDKFLELVGNLFRKLAQMFKSANAQDITTQINNIFGETARSILSNQLELGTISNEESAVMFQLDSNKKMNDDLRQTLINAIEIVHKKAVLFKDTDKEEAVGRFNALEARLKERLEHDQVLLGFTDFTKVAIRDINAIYAEFNKNLALIKSQSENMGVADAAKLAKYLRTALSYTAAYKESLKDIHAQMISNPQLNRFKDYKRYIDMAKVIKATLGSVELIEQDYYATSRPLVATFLKEFSSLDGKVYQAYADRYVTVEEALQEADQDISIYSRLLDSLADTHDGVLQLIDVAVKNSKNLARIGGLDTHKQFVAMYEDLKKAGINDTTWMYETYNGKLTGNLVSEINWGAYNEEKERFFSEEHTTAEIAVWYETNNQPLTNLEEVLMARRKEYIDVFGLEDGNTEYNKWLSKNMLERREGNIFIKELSQPNVGIYSNHEYEAILTNPTKSKFYSEFRTLYDELINMLPEQFRHSERAPQIRKDLWERLKQSSGLGVSVNSLKESVEDALLLTEDETEFGMIDENGQTVQFVPTSFIKMIGHWTYNQPKPVVRKEDMTDEDFDVATKEYEKAKKLAGKRVVNLSQVSVEERTFVKTPEQMSTDLISVAVAFGYMAHNNKEMSKIVDILELAKDVVGERNVVTTTSKGKAILDKVTAFAGLNKKVSTKGVESEGYKRLSAYLDMVVYGQMKEQEGEINFLGKSFDKAKVLDALGRYTAISSLALNVYSGVSNVVYGSGQIRSEAITGEFFDNKHLLRADRIYATNIASVMADMGSINPTSKMGLMFERYNILNNYEEQVGDIEAARSRAGRLANTSALFFINHAGEHWMQGRTAIAMMLNTKLKKGDQEINLWDAYEVVDGKLKLVDGVEWNTTQENRWSMRLFHLNHALHGIYNTIDKSVIQKKALGRLAVMFRKFIRPGFIKRWGHKKYSESGQRMTEGNYVTFLRFMKSLMSDLKHMKTVWNSLSDMEKKNVQRTLIEVGYMIAAFVLIGILSSLSGDDDDDWAANMTAYQANRLFTELQFYYNPIEALKILKSPSAAVSQIEKLITFLGGMKELATLPFGGDLDVIERGSWKGTTKLGKAFWTIIPMGRTIHDIQTPNEKLKFFVGN